MLLQENEYEKQTSLNPKSFWGIWSRLTTDDYAKDSCSLIKNSFFSILLLPLWIFPGLLVNGISMWRNVFYGIKYWHWTLINIGLLTFGGLVQYANHINHTGIEFILYSYVISITISVFILLAITIILVFTFLWDYVTGKIKDHFRMKKFEKDEKNEMPVIKTFLKDLKKKHCTLIHWDKK